MTKCTCECILILTKTMNLTLHHAERTTHSKSQFTFFHYKSYISNIQMNNICRKPVNGLPISVKINKILNSQNQIQLRTCRELLKGKQKRWLPYACALKKKRKEREWKKKTCMPALHTKTQACVWVVSLSLIHWHRLTCWQAHIHTFMYIYIHVHIPSLSHSYAYTQTAHIY